MKAVRKIEPKPGIVVQEIEEPTIGPSQVLVEIKATAICGSDLHIYRWDEQTARWKTPLPMTVGHEFSGKVVEVGNEVRSLRPGDNVSGESHIPCGTCYYCRTGNMHICKDMLIFGLQTREGSFAHTRILASTASKQGEQWLSMTSRSIDWKKSFETYLRNDLPKSGPKS